MPDNQAFFDLVKQEIASTKSRIESLESEIATAAEHCRISYAEGAKVSLMIAKINKLREAQRKAEEHLFRMKGNFLMHVISGD